MNILRRRSKDDRPVEVNNVNTIQVPPKKKFHYESSDDSDDDNKFVSHLKPGNLGSLATDSLYVQHNSPGQSEKENWTSPGPTERNIRVVSRANSRLSMKNNANAVRPTNFVPRGVSNSSMRAGDSAKQSQTDDVRNSNGSFKPPQQSDCDPLPASWAKAPKKFLEEDESNVRNSNSSWNSAKPGGIVKASAGETNRSNNDWNYSNGSNAKLQRQNSNARTEVEDDTLSQASANTIDDAHDDDEMDDDRYHRKPNRKNTNSRRNSNQDEEEGFGVRNKKRESDGTDLTSADNSTVNTAGTSPPQLQERTDSWAFKTSMATQLRNSSLRASRDSNRDSPPLIENSPSRSKEREEQPAPAATSNSYALVRPNNAWTSNETNTPPAVGTPYRSANSGVKQSFVLIAHPRGLRTEHVQCTIVRDRSSVQGKLYPTYELILDESRKSLITARKMSLNRTSNYHLFDMTRGKVNGNFSKKAGNYLGKLRAKNTSRTGYVLLNHNADSEELMAVMFDRISMFEQFRDGNQPRVLKLLLPDLNDDNVPIATPIGTLPGCESMFDLLQEVEESKRILPSEYHICQTKEPVFENGNYRLNFHGRVTVPSVKNFQIVSEFNVNDVLCQFGKVDKDTFHLDYKAPLNAVQAFALALCQFNL